MAVTGFFDEAVYGCVGRSNYAVTRGPAASTLPRLKGRPLKVLKDIWPAILFEIKIVMDDAQFAGWQLFWTTQANRGSKPFRIRLRMSDLFVYEDGIEVYEVLARTPWKASYSPAGFWDVSLSVESPAITLFLGKFCDSIYGGPITNLSPDSIYGGPLDNLAEDIISPCEEILP